MLNKKGKRKYHPNEFDAQKIQKLQELKKKQAQIGEQRGDMRKFAQNQKVKFEILKHKIFNQMGGRNDKSRRNSFYTAKERVLYDQNQSMNIEVMKKPKKRVRNPQKKIEIPNKNLKLGTGLMEFSDEKMINLPLQVKKHDISRKPYPKNKPNQTFDYDDFEDTDEEDLDPKKNQVFQNKRQMSKKNSMLRVNNPKVSDINISNSNSNSRLNLTKDSKELRKNKLDKNKSSKNHDKLIAQLQNITKHQNSNTYDPYNYPKANQDKSLNLPQRSMKSNVRSSRQASFKVKRRQNRSYRDPQESKNRFNYQAKTQEPSRQESRRMPELQFKMKPTNKQLAVLAMKKKKKINMKELSFQRDRRGRRSRTQDLQE